MDRPGVRQVPEGSGEQGKMEKTGCKIICGASTTLAVRGLMMMMMILPNVKCWSQNWQCSGWVRIRARVGGLVLGVMGYGLGFRVRV